MYSCNWRKRTISIAEYEGRLPRVADFVKMHRDIMEAKEEVGPSKAVKVLVWGVLQGMLEIWEVAGVWALM